MTLALAWLPDMRAAHVTPNTRDTLAYKDGDRIQGVFVQRSGGMIIFRSDRFGEIQVPADDAVVIKADAPPAAGPSASAPAGRPTAPTAAGPAKVTEKHRDEEERVSRWDRFSPSVLTARVRDYFGPWQGRLAFSAQVVSDVAERNNSSYEALLQRKWTNDEVQVTARYDYSETNNLTTSDLVKASGLWRHDFTRKFFGNYRPTTEWDRASKLKGGPNDYVLLQQELGIGYHVFAKPGRKVSVGISENLFDTWKTEPMHEHNSRAVVSTFEEVELTLPWRITISQRGVWYPVPGDEDGWENRVDLNKKLTETLSAALRHEIRRHHPDGSAQDYTRLKFLFGLDF